MDEPKQQVVYNISFDTAGYPALGWMSDGKTAMYFEVKQRQDGLYQCWHMGDDTTPLSPEEAFPVGAPAPTIWLALPAALRAEFADPKPCSPLLDDCTRLVNVQAGSRPR